MDLCETVVDSTANNGCSARPLCHCLNISEGEVRDVIDADNLQSVRAVSKACGAGGGCTACHRHIKRLLNEQVVRNRLELVGISSREDNAIGCCVAMAGS